MRPWLLAVLLWLAPPATASTVELHAACEHINLNSTLAQRRSPAVRGATGDRVLQRVAQLLREASPAQRAYRYGGEEFAVLLPRNALHEVGALAEQLRRCIAEDSRTPQVSVSIGLACNREPGSPPRAIGFAPPMPRCIRPNAKAAIGWCATAQH